VNPRRRAAIFFGGSVLASGLSMAQLRYSTRGLIPDGLLMRVSNISRDEPKSYRLHDAFMNGLVAAKPAQERRRLVGGEPGSAA
jgi:hypothetical protein